MPKAEDGVTKEETGAAPERAKAGACTPSDREIPLVGNNQQCEPQGLRARMLPKVMFIITKNG